MKKELLFQLIAVFLAVQLLGLWTADFLARENIKATIVSENANGIENSFGLFAYILVFTVALLILIRLLRGKRLFVLFKVIEALAIFGTSALVFSTALPDAFALGLAAILVIARNVKRESIRLRNLASVLAAAGAGALIGVSLGIIPVIVFMALLAVYDYIAVFRTKHMVALAKAITKRNLSFTIAMPTKEHKFEMGTGDLVVPLAFATAVLASSKISMPFPNYFVAPALVLLASLAGLIATLEYGSRHKEKALPALPLQTIAMIIVFGIAKLAGF